MLLHPFYTKTAKNGRWDFCLRTEREERSHKDQLYNLSGVQPGIPAISYFLTQSFTVTETYVEFI